MQAVWQRMGERATGARGLSAVERRLMAFLQDTARARARAERKARAAGPALPARRARRKAAA